VPAPQPSPPQSAVRCAASHSSVEPGRGAEGWRRRDGGRGGVSTAALPVGPVGAGRRLLAHPQCSNPYTAAPKPTEKIESCTPQQKHCQHDGRSS